jgi:hypothetical protein
MMAERGSRLPEQQHQRKRPDVDSSRWERVGIFGLLAAALVAFGLGPFLLPESYSVVEDGISESGAQGIEQAWPTRLGFIAFGLAVVWLTAVRRSDWQPLASLLHLLFGVSMFGVAAFSARPWEENAPYVQLEDSIHSWFASVMGFAFVTGVVTLVVIRRQRSLTAALPDWVALIVTTLVPLAMSTAVWGLLQRLMFVTAAAWYGREALLDASQTGMVRRR